MSYYAREGAVNTDGTPLYAIGYDKDREAECCALIASAWGCRVVPFGRLCPIDFYAERDGRLVGVLELKSRSHDTGTFPTVFLNVRKWIALRMASLGLACPAVFVVRFNDDLRWIALDDIDASDARMGGTRKLVKSGTDIEPVIEVPVDQMQRLKDQQVAS